MAANWRRTVGVCTHADTVANGFLLRRVVWIGGGVLLNGVTAAAIIREGDKFSVLASHLACCDVNQNLHTTTPLFLDCGFWWSLCL